jgi:hypothetical protein
VPVLHPLVALADQMAMEWSIWSGDASVLLLDLERLQPTYQTDPWWGVLAARVRQLRVRGAGIAALADRLGRALPAALLEPIK